MTMESIRAKNNGMAHVPRLGDEARCHGSPAKNLRHVRKSVPSDQPLSLVQNAEGLENAVTEQIPRHLPCSTSSIQREKHAPRCDQMPRLKEKPLFTRRTFSHYRSLRIYALMGMRFLTLEGFTKGGRKC